MKRIVLLWVLALTLCVPNILGSHSLTPLEQAIRDCEARRIAIALELSKPRPVVDWDKKLATKEDVLDLIIKVSREEDINPVFVMAIVAAESNFEHRAVSRMGAIGLMQVMPRTAWWLDSGLDVYNPWDNLKLGIRYFKMMRAKFKGYTKLALAAYNAGPGNVIRAGWNVPKIRETQLYVPRVLAYWNKYKEVADV